MNATALQGCRTLTRVAGGAVFIIGSAGLAGWIFDVESFRTAFTDDVAMKANTAVCLLMAGLALLLLAPHPQRRSPARTWIARAMAIVIGLIGGATLTQYFTGVNLGIDQLLFHEPPGAAATSSPGRMGYPASSSFMLACLAMLLLDLASPRQPRIDSDRLGRFAPAPHEYPAMAMCLIAMLPVIGYAYDLRPLYGISQYTGIALHTALALLLLGVGLLSARPAAGIAATLCADDAGGMMARRLILPAILLPFLLGWVRTLGERAGWVDIAFGRSMMVLSLVVSFVTLIWWNAAALSQLGRQRRRAEDERLRDQQQLQVREHQMRIAQSAAKVGTYELDIATGATVWSEGIWALIGQAPDDQPTTLARWQSHIHPEDRDETNARFEQIIASGQRDFYLEFRIVRRDGGVRWVASKGQIVRDPLTARPLQVYGATYDITERRCAEEAVRESEERLRLGLAAGNTGTWDWDMLANRVTWSDRIYTFHGVTPQTFDGGVEEFLALVHPDDRQRVADQVQRAIRDRTEYHEEFRALHPSGQVRWLTTTGKVFYDEAGKAVRMLGATADITERKEFERQRDELLARERQARAEAERASEAKSEFLATLSHELRTPLTPVLLTLPLMQAHPGFPPELVEHLTTIRRNIELESQLISDLLDLTRVARGKLRLDPRPIDLHAIVRAAAGIFQQADASTSARLKLDLGAANNAVLGDDTRLQQVFWNLISNAIKFTPPDGQIVVRSFDTASSATADGQDGGGPRVCVEVSDTGQGIDADVLPRLFNAFEQGDVRASRQQAGLGLGLAISRKLVEAHGGTIAAASSGRGLGATFTVELPAIGAHVDAPAAQSDGSRGPVSATPTMTIAAAAAATTMATMAAASTATRSLNVLLVEDHEPTLNVMTLALRHMGHRVTGATTLAAARGLAGQQGYDMMISDLGLPDGSGLDLMRQLRAQFAGRAIALTGYGMDADIIASREAGFAAHLIKPIDLDQLSAVIARLSSEGAAAPLGFGALADTLPAQ